MLLCSGLVIARTKKRKNEKTRYIIEQAVSAQPATPSKYHNAHIESVTSP